MLSEAFFKINSYMWVKHLLVGIRCGSVDRTVASNKVHSANPVIDKIYIEHCLLSTALKKTKIKKKRLEMAHLKNLLVSSKQCDQMLE